MILPPWRRMTVPLFVVPDADVGKQLRLRIESFVPATDGDLLFQLALTIIVFRSPSLCSFFLLPAMTTHCQISNKYGMSHP